MHELLRSRGFVRRAGDAPSSGDQEGVGRQSVRSDERAAKERRERPSLDDHDKSRVQRERAYAKERRRAREDLSRDRTAGEKKEFRRKAVADHEGEGMEREVSRLGVRRRGRGTMEEGVLIYVFFSLTPEHRLSRMIWL